MTRAPPTSAATAANLDRPAKVGARFEKIYTSARCRPTRASLITGLHPQGAGIGDFVSADSAPWKRCPY